MRRLLIAGLLACALTLGLAGCDTYGVTNSLGHCEQARVWPGTNGPLASYSLINWSRVAYNNDWVYRCRGHNYLTGITLCWWTNYANSENPPHSPNIYICPTPAA